MINDRFPTQTIQKFSRFEKMLASNDDRWKTSVSTSSSNSSDTEIEFDCREYNSFTTIYLEHPPQQEKVKPKQNVYIVQLDSPFPRLTIVCPLLLQGALSLRPFDDGSGKIGGLRIFLSLCTFSRFNNLGLAMDYHSPPIEIVVYRVQMISLDKMFPFSMLWLRSFCETCKKRKKDISKEKVHRSLSRYGSSS